MESYRVILPPGQWGEVKETGVSWEEMEIGGIGTSAPPSPTGVETTGGMKENNHSRILHRPRVIYNRLTMSVYAT